MTTREAIEARLLTLLPETQAIMVNVSQLRDICASHATVEAERDRLKEQLAEVQQALGSSDPDIVASVQAAESRAEALARAVREMIAHCIECGGSGRVAVIDGFANHNVQTRDAKCWRCGDVRALLALDVQESS